jgi:hypothetical protein
MDSVNDWGKLQELSKLYWTARKKIGVIPLTAVGQKSINYFVL